MSQNKSEEPSANSGAPCIWCASHQQQFMLSSVRSDGKIMGLGKGKAAAHPLGLGRRVSSCSLRHKALKRAVQTLHCISGTLLSECAFTGGLQEPTQRGFLPMTSLLVLLAKQAL